MAETPTKICFVSMPFGVKHDQETEKTIDFDSIYQLVISPAADAEGFVTVRADNTLPSGRILDQVVERIMAADLFIGDISTLNPNVFYEIGLRHMTAKLCMLIARKGVKIPFDLAGYRVYMYSDQQDDVKNARYGLQATINALLAGGPSAGSPVSIHRLKELQEGDKAAEKSQLDALGLGLMDTMTSIERRLFSLETSMSQFSDGISTNSFTSSPFLEKGKPTSRRIFVVHGRSEIADSLRTQVVAFLMKLKLESVILSEQAEGGRALPNKLDEEMADVGYAFVLLTPDDIGAHSKQLDEMRPRARQNVIYEHGLFVGRLGLSRICAIQMSDVELPSDLSGIIPKVIAEGEALDRIYLDLVKELRMAEYEVDANNLFSR